MGLDVSTLAVRVTSDGIKDTADGLGRIANEADKAERRVSTLTASISKLTNVFVQGTASAQAYQEAVAQANRQVGGHNATTTALTQSMQLLTNAVTGLSGNLSSLNVRTRESANSITFHKAAMEDAHAAARGLSGALGALWVTYGNMIPLAAGLAIGAGFKAVVAQGREVEQTLESIRVKGNESIESVGKIRETLLTLGQGVYGPKEVANAFETLILAGLDAKQALVGIKDALNLATVGGTTIEKASYTLVQVGTSLGYTAEGYSRVADVIAKTAATSMSSVESISEAFKAGSVVGKLYGATLVDIGTSFAALSNLGIQGSAAGTALKNFYKELSSEGKKVVQTLQEMHVETKNMIDDQGKFLPLAELIPELAKGLSNLSAADQQLAKSRLSNERGMKVLVELLDLYSAKNKEYSNELLKYNKEINESWGYTAIGAAAMSLTVNNQLKSVTNTLQTTFVKAFEDIQPQLSVFSSKLKETFSSPEFIAGVRQVSLALAEVAAWVAQNIPLLTTLVQLFLGFKTVAFVAGLVVNIAQGFLTLKAAADAAKVSAIAFQFALGGFGALLAGVGIAFAYFISEKEKLGQSTQAQASLTYVNNFTDSLKEESKRLDEQIRLMKQATPAAEAYTNALRNRNLQMVKEQGQKNIDDAQNTAMQLKSKLSDSDKKIYNRANALGDRYALFSPEVSKVLEAEKKVEEAVKASAKAYGDAQKELDGVIAREKVAAELADAQAKKRNKVTGGDGHLSKFGGAGSDARKQDLENNLLEIQGVFNKEKAIYESRVEMLKEYYKKEGLSSTEYFAGSKVALDEYVAAKTEAFKKEQSLIESYKGKNAVDNGENKKRLTKLVNDYQQFIQEMNSAFSKLNVEELDVAKKATDDAIKAIDNQGNKEIATLKQTLEAQKKHNSEIGKTKEQIEAVRAAREQQAIQEIQFQADAYQNVLNMNILNEGETKIYQEQLIKLKEKLAVMRQTEAEYRSGTLLQAQADAVKKASDAWVNLDRKIETDLANAIVDGGGKGWKKLIKDMEVAFAKMILQPILAPISAGIASIVNPNAPQASGGSGLMGMFNNASSAYQFYNNNSLSGLYNSAMGFFGGAGSMGAIGASGITASSLGSASGLALTGAGSGLGFSAGGLGAAEGMSLVGSGASTGMTLGSGAVGSATGAAGAISGAAGSAGSSFGSGGAMKVAGWIGLGMMVDNMLYNKGFKPNWSSIDSPIGKLISAPDFSINKTLKALGMGDKLASILSGSSISQYLFGRSIPKITNSGIEGTVTSSGFKDSRNFADITEEGGLFSGDDNYSKYSALDKGVQSVLSNAFASSYRGFNELGKVIGAGSDVIKDFSYNFKVSMNGLNDEDSKKKMKAALASTSDAMANAFVDKFRDTVKVVTTKKTSDWWFADSITETHTEAKQAAKSNLDPYIGDILRIFDDFKTSLKDVKDAEGKLSSFTASLFSLGQGFVETKGYITEFGEALDFKKLEAAAIDVETVLDTFNRLDTIFSATNNIALLLGQNAATAFGAAGLASTDARQRLIDLAGGLDTLASSAAYYSQNFLTATEQIAPTVIQVRATLASLGASSVTTRDQFKALVSSLDLSTDAGAKEYATLMKLAPAFVQITDYVDQLKKSAIEAAKAQADYLMSTAESAFSALKNAVDAEKTRAQATHDAQVKDIQALAEQNKKVQNDLLSAAQTSNSAINSIFESLTNAIKTTQVESSALNAQRRQSAISLLTNAVGFTNTGGDVSKVSGLTDALAEVAKPSQDLYSSFEDYARDQSIANNAIQELQSNAKSQLSATQLTINAINDTIKAIDSASASQVAALDSALNTELARLDAIVSNAQLQLDALKGINDSVLSVAAALQGFNGSVANVKANPVASATSVITDAYQQNLHRDPEQAGLEYWQNQVASGALTASGAAWNIANSNEAKVQELYGSVLGRVGETAGVDYWTNLANSGMSIDDIKWNFLNSAEYKSLHPSFDVGTNSVPYDMLANIHEGERIIPAADNREIIDTLRNARSGGDYSAEERRQIVEAINRLCEYIKTGDVANVQQTKEVVKILRKFDGEGMPETRSV